MNSSTKPKSLTIFCTERRKKPLTHAPLSNRSGKKGDDAIKSNETNIKKITVIIIVIKNPFLFQCFFFRSTLHFRVIWIHANIMNLNTRYSSAQWTECVAITILKNRKNENAQCCRAIFLLGERKKWTASKQVTWRQKASR